LTCVFNQRTRCHNPQKVLFMRENDVALIRPLDVVVAGVLLTRLPLPRLPDTAFARQASAVWAFALVGLAVGGLAVLAGLAGLALGWPASVAAAIVLTVQIVSTGAMHEDGLADTADGFWGGWTPERRLEIMKDSQIGTYGVLALVLSVGVRWMAISTLIQGDMLALIATATLSRAIIPPVMATLPFARPDGLSRSVGVPSKRTCVLTVVLGLVLAMALAGVASLLAAALAGLAIFGLARLARNKIGGQTGDVLGASQQLAELTSLLVFLSLA
jgi:adenosylcobinamide-GDP ribazoletransferase